MNRSTTIRFGVAAVAIFALVLIAIAALKVEKKDDPAIRVTYILNEEPSGAAEVLAVRENAKDDDDVTVVGRIGGRENPWIKGTAAFSIVDTTLKPCNEIASDTCPTPWDYCCEPDLAKATLLVTILDEKTGQTLKQDARDVLNLSELQTVVLQGKARRDKKGNVTIAASKIFVRPEKKKADK
jgi:hypothetical protein